MFFRGVGVNYCTTPLCEKQSKKYFSRKFFSLFFRGGGVNYSTTSGIFTEFFFNPPKLFLKKKHVFDGIFPKSKKPFLKKKTRCSRHFFQTRIFFCRVFRGFSCLFTENLLSQEIIFQKIRNEKIDVFAEFLDLSRKMFLGSQLLDSFAVFFVPGGGPKVFKKDFRGNYAEKFLSQKVNALTCYWCKNLSLLTIH